MKNLIIDAFSSWSPPSHKGKHCTPVLIFLYFSCTSQAEGNGGWSELCLLTLGPLWAALPPTTTVWHQPVSCSGTIGSPSSQEGCVCCVRQGGPFILVPAFVQSSCPGPGPASWVQIQDPHPRAGFPNVPAAESPPGRKRWPQTSRPAEVGEMGRSMLWGGEVVFAAVPCSRNCQSTSCPPASCHFCWQLSAIDV